MPNTSDPFGRLQSAQAKKSSQAEAPDVLDDKPCMDTSFIFHARETEMTFHLHQRIGKYAEYGSLFKSPTPPAHS